MKAFALIQRLVFLALAISFATAQYNLYLKPSSSGGNDASACTSSTSACATLAGVRSSSFQPPNRKAVAKFGTQASVQITVLEPFVNTVTQTLGGSSTTLTTLAIVGLNTVDRPNFPLVLDIPSASYPALTSITLNNMKWDGATNRRLLNASPTNLQMDKMTIQNGNPGSTTPGVIRLFSATTLSVSITNSTISNNQNVGLYLSSTSTAISLTTTTANSNVGTGNGGLFFVGNLGSLSISTSTFQSNGGTTASGGIGVIYPLSTATMTINDNTFTSNSAGSNYYGGCFYVSSGNTVTLNVKNNVFTGNTANYGACFFLSSFGKLTATIEGNTFDASNLVSNGGGFYLSGTAVTGSFINMTNNIVRNHTPLVANAQGHLIYYTQQVTSSIVLKGNQFSNNIVNSMVRASSAATLTSTNNYFDNTNCITGCVYIALPSGQTVATGSSTNDTFNNVISPYMLGFPPTTTSLTVTSLVTSGTTSGTAVRTTGSGTALVKLMSVTVAVNSNFLIAELKTNNLQLGSAVFNYNSILDRTLLQFDQPFATAPADWSSVTITNFNTTAQCYANVPHMTIAYYERLWNSVNCMSLTDLSPTPVSQSISGIYVLRSEEMWLPMANSKATLTSGCLKLVGAVNITILAGTVGGSTWELINTAGANCLQGTFSSVNIDNSANRYICSAVPTYSANSVSIKYMACPSLASVVTANTTTASFVYNQAVYSGETLQVSSATLLTINNLGYALLQPNSKLNIQVLADVTNNTVQQLITSYKLQGTFTSVTFNSTLNRHITKVETTYVDPIVQLKYISYSSLTLLPPTVTTLNLVTDYAVYFDETWSVAAGTTLTQDAGRCVILQGGVNVVISPETQPGTTNLLQSNCIQGIFSQISTDNSANLWIDSAVITYPLSKITSTLTGVASIAPQTTSGVIVGGRGLYAEEVWVVQSDIVVQVTTLALAGTLNVTVLPTTPYGSVSAIAQVSATQGQFAAVNVDLTATPAICSVEVDYETLAVKLVYNVCPSLVNDTLEGHGVVNLTGNRVHQSVETWHLDTDLELRVNVNGVVTLEGVLDMAVGQQVRGGDRFVVLAANTLVGDFGSHSVANDRNLMIYDIQIEQKDNQVAVTMEGYPSLIETDVSTPLTGTYGLYYADEWKPSSETSVSIDGDVILLGSINVTISPTAERASSVVLIKLSGNIVSQFRQVSIDNSQNPSITSVTIEYIPAAKRDGEAQVVMHFDGPALTTGAIVGIVVGSVAFLGLLVLLVLLLLFLRRKTPKPKKSKTTAKSDDVFNDEDATVHEVDLTSVYMEPHVLDLTGIYVEPDRRTK